MRTPTRRTCRALAAVCAAALGLSVAPQLVQVPLRTAHVGTGAQVVAEERVPEDPLDVRRRPRRTPPVASRSRVVPAPGAMPVGNLRGWRQVLAEDFRSGRLPRGWDRYAGSPGGNPNGWWQQDHAAVRNGDLHLLGDWQHGTLVTGGVMATAWPSTYGKYEVRFKVSRAAGVPYAMLLWPVHGSWPEAGEIDFAEDAGGARRGMTATLHYGPGNTQLQRQVRADFTQFQTVGVEWTPGRIVYTLNGRPWAVVGGAHVPAEPMRLALQLEAGHGNQWSPAPSRATPRTVDMDIDWVVAYRRA